jgi:hypothetical protein
MSMFIIIHCKYACGVVVLVVVVQLVVSTTPPAPANQLEGTFELRCLHAIQH